MLGLAAQRMGRSDSVDAATLRRSLHLVSGTTLSITRQRVAIDGRKMDTPNAGIPTVRQLIPSVLKALEACGGEASNEQIEEFARRIFALEAGVGGAGRSELGYRLAWARTKLRQDGKIERRTRGSWALIVR
jgi:hypothetical protein